MAKPDPLSALAHFLERKDAGHNHASTERNGAEAARQGEIINNGLECQRSAIRDCTSASNFKDCFLKNFSNCLSGHKQRGQSHSPCSDDLPKRKL